ncbi:hypothetical protein MTBMA_c14800 [Methanothermobacter marburgensis str. Marburg]|uniref:Uncharacterized protein n=1 Tax=Methanothermobacter marburgensis (strain ATCC BAA-927 / DSM 2133 / JCM 14651 / NBRC 100331 / OCM 82 / Marburg) TaxID=79929 RepID=D9PXW1_METTM|nr:hypothetical protein MTBMA_c14800 [Methanothermobacter marburgensis str. Marburg]
MRDIRDPGHNTDSRWRITGRSDLMVFLVYTSTSSWSWDEVTFTGDDGPGVNINVDLQDITSP